MSMARIGRIRMGEGRPIVLIAGPCVVETRDMALRTADRIQAVARKHRIPVIFKASYKKANRTSGSSFMGLDPDKALGILAEVRSETGMAVLTDVHSAMEAGAAAEVADVLQVPAFLCRQTEILQAVGRTGKAVNIKKGQFMAPEDMREQALKVASTGNKNLMLTERGASFGYHNLVVDMRSLKIMRKFGYPVVFDATHSVQIPGGGSDHSTGEPEFIFPLARAAVAVGIDGLFVETHPDPRRALSDAGSQLKLSLLDTLVGEATTLDRIVKEKFER